MSAGRTKPFLAALALLVVGLLAPASNAARPAVSMSVAPQAIDFGVVAQGGTSSQSFSFTNTTKTAITINGWGVNGGPFTYAERNASSCPLVFRNGGKGHGPLLIQGQTCTFTVIAQTYGFPPGTHSAHFYVLDGNDAQIVRVPLTVTVVAT